MITKQQLKDQLSAWTPGELLLKECYEAKKAGKDISEILENSDLDKVLKDKANYTEESKPVITDDDYFHDDRNIIISRHPRYMPVFFHKHTFFEIVYVLSGHCTQIFDKSEIHLATGNLCFIAPSTTHAISVIDNSIVLNLLIRHETLMDIFMNTVRDKSTLAEFLLSGYYEQPKYPYLICHIGKDRIIRNYILDMYEEQIHFDEYSDRILCSIMTLFFAQLTRRHGGGYELANNASETDKITDAILSFILNHYASVTLEELSKQFHFSASYCSKLIYASTGHTFLQLLNDVRIQRATSLLANTKLPVSKISTVVGYKNTETFIRNFQKKQGKTPGQYRTCN